MAKLTPLAKGMIAFIVVGGAAAASWQLGIKDVVNNSLASDNNLSAEVKHDDNQPIGSPANPLKVSIVSFHGYAPGLVAAGNSLVSKPDSLFNQLGVNVEFVIQDDVPELATIFTSNTAQCAWRTSDFWAQEQPNLVNAGLDARAVMVVDNTQGGDAVITRDASINSIEDLAGKRVALLQYTPSHGMIIDAVENSSLSARKKQSIEYVYVQAAEGTAGVRSMFNAGHVDAAVLWDPDLSLALKSTPGSKVVYSTKTATNLIYDVMVCNKKYLDDPANTQTFQAFVEGWMNGVSKAKSNPAIAVDALVNTEQFFSQLEQQEGRGFIQGLFANVVWTGLDDNIRVLGLAGGTNHYARVYQRFDSIYRSLGALANPNSPVIDPQQSFDTRFIKNMMSRMPAARTLAEKPQFEFNAEERDQVTSTKSAALEKPVMVGFDTGRASLSKRAMKIVDTEMVPIIENNGAAYFVVSGNTDSTGSQNTNMHLSQQRAQAVVDYLVTEWEFPLARFKVIGNGPSKPLCNESSPDDGQSLDECRARNRTTRLAIVGR